MIFSGPQCEQKGDDEKQSERQKAALLVDYSQHRFPEGTGRARLPDRSPTYSFLSTVDTEYLNFVRIKIGIKRKIISFFFSFQGKVSKYNLHVNQHLPDTYTFHGLNKL